MDILSQLSELLPILPPFELSKIGLITNQTIRKQYLQNTGILYIKTSNNNEVTCNFTKFQEELENSN